MAASDEYRQAATGTKVVSPQANLAAFLEKNKKQIDLAVPKHLNADRICRLTMTAFSQNSALQECSLVSIFGAVITSAQMGLEIGVAGQGYLVPYKGKAQFVPGWQGLVDLVSRSGRGSVYTGVIYTDQRYTFTDGSKRELVVHNETDLDDWKEITHAYAVGWVRDAAIPIIELWSMEKITKHRNKYNKVGTKHYSYENMEMYARKVPLLQVIKYMPKSIELLNALDLNDAVEQGKHATLDGVSVRIDDDEPEQTTRRDGGGGSEPGTGEGAAAARKEEKKQDGEAGDKKKGGAPTVDDAISLVRQGKDEEARDLARQLGPDALKSVEGVILSRDGNRKAKGAGGMSLD